jgi:hypothetical protein
MSVLLVGIGGLMAYQGVWAGVGVITFATLFILHLFLTTYYQIGRNEVRIRSGILFDKTVQISTIKAVVETGNPLSSPALSLDRIELKYNRFDSVLISPDDKGGFIADLLRIKPEIEVRLKPKSKKRQ